MKRHPALAHLSRDHHPALMLAQLLKQNAPVYKGLPADTEGKLQYALKFYQDDLITHFEEEEEMMEMVGGINPELDEKIKEIKAEHILLHGLFNSLGASADVIPHMNTLGMHLEKHIRKEERELFPLVEKNCDEQMMDAIEKILTRR